MRLALLGPAGDRPDLLEAAVRRLAGAGIDRGVYLGVDGALDGVVRKLAAELVGDNPSDEGLFARAARACAAAGPEAIDAHLAAERRRSALRAFDALPDADTRSVELVDGALAVIIHDKARLDEEDMLPARVLVFGLSRSPVVRQVGQRWFLAPGTFGEAGLMLLEDGDGGLEVHLHDAELAPTRSERLRVGQQARVRVGAP